MLIRRNPALPVLRSEYPMNRVFEDFFRDFDEGFDAVRYPAVDTWEDEKSFTVEAELPGLKEKEIEISVLGNELRISGGHEEQKEESNAKYHRRERFSGRFSRVIRFPVEIDQSKVEAKYEAGILRIGLPKAAASLPRKIEVKS